MLGLASLQKKMQNNLRQFAFCAGQLLDTAWEQVAVCSVHSYNGVAGDAKLV